MAIQFDAASQAYSADTTSLTIPHTCSGSDRHLTVGIVMAEGVAITTQTYNGASLTQIAAHDQPGGSNLRLVLLGLVAPATGTNNVQLSFDTSTEVWVGVVSRTGVDQTSPVSGFATDDVGSGTSGSVDVSSASGDLVIGLAGTTSQGLTSASGSGQTARTVKPSQANGEYNGVMDDELGATLVNMAYEWNLNRFASFIGARLAAAAEGGAVTGSGQAILPALGVRAVANDAVFSDDFVGPDSDPVDSGKWTVTTSGTAAADLQGNRLRMFADGTNEDSNVRLEAALPQALADVRIECEFERPAESGEYFFTFAVRFAPPNDYYLSVSRDPSQGVNETVWQLVKFMSGDSTPLTGQITLGETESRYRLRFEAVGSTIRGVVRPVSAGPIPEGVWDLTTTDTDITGPGTVSPSLTRRDQPDAGAPATAYIDHWQVFAPAPAATGAGTLPGLGVSATGTLGAGGPISGSGTATLPAVTVRGKANDAVFNDDFVGPNGSAPHVSRWANTTIGDALADLQDNRLHLFADSATGEASVQPVADVLLTHARVDCVVELPPAGGQDRFFWTIGLRATPANPLEAYYLNIFRSPPENQLRWVLSKYVATDDPPNTGLTSTSELGNSVLRYRVRLEVVGSTIRGSVRDASLGPIPEGSWDKTATDSALTGQRTARTNLTKLPSEGTGDVYVDEVQFFDSAAVGTGAAGLPALAVTATGSISGTGPISGTATAQLAGLVVDAAGTVTTPTGHVNGSGQAALPAIAARGVVNDALFNDDFTGPDGSAVDSTLWDTYGSGTFVIDRQQNRMRLDATGGMTTGSSGASAVAKLPYTLFDVRIEYEVWVPPTGTTGEFFSTMALRMPVHSTPPVGADYDGYRLFIFRNGPAASLIARILKEVGGVGTPLTSDLILSNAITRYRARLEVEGTNLRAAVRPYADGPIPPDEWDFETADAELTNPGTIRQHFTKGDAAGNRNFYVDHLQIFDLAPDVRPGTGTATLPALAAAGQATVQTTAIGGNGVAALPALQATGLAAALAGGEGVAQLPALQAGGTGIAVVHGAGIAMLPGLAASGTGAVAIAGQGTATLPPLQISASTATAVAGDGVALLPALQARGVAAALVRGSGVAKLSALATLGATTAVVRGDGLAALPGLQASGIAAVALEGVGIARLPALQVTGATALQVGGTGVARLPALTASGVGGVLVSGQAVAKLPALQVAAVAAPEAVGLGVVVLPALTASGSGRTQVQGSAVVVLPSLAASGDASALPAGGGIARLPALGVSGFGAVLVTGQGVARLPAFRVSGSTAVLLEGAGVAVLPALAVQATGLVAAGVENLNMDLRITQPLALRVWINQPLDLNLRIEPEDD